MAKSGGSFSYEQLHVYQDIRLFLAEADRLISAWSSVHAVADQLDRASESILANLAEGCRAHSVKAKQAAVESSLGSVLECAACMDVADAKQLIDDRVRHLRKRDLGIIFGKLIGLRSSWNEPGVRESNSVYGQGRDQQGSVFHHERLDAYQLGLGVIRELTSVRLLERLPRTSFRRVDELATSIVLNIAEGNGRFAHLEHRRFLDIANRSATKLAARLDVCVLRGYLDPEEQAHIKGLLVRIDATTVALAAKWGGDSRRSDRQGSRQGSRCC